jgi:hypothetical protein
MKIRATRAAFSGSAGNPVKPGETENVGEPLQRVDEVRILLFAVNRYKNSPGKNPRPKLRAAILSDIF